MYLLSSLFAGRRYFSLRLCRLGANSLFTQFPQSYHLLFLSAWRQSLFQSPARRFRSLSATQHSVGMKLTHQTFGLLTFGLITNTLAQWGNHRPAPPVLAAAAAPVVSVSTSSTSVAGSTSTASTSKSKSNKVVLAAAAPAVSVASVATSVTSAADGTSTPLANNKVLASSSSTAGSVSDASCDGVPVTFVANGGDYNWAIRGPGYTSNSGNSASGQPITCLTAGSPSLFIGSDASTLGQAAGGNTLFECTIVASGASICDISLCDGYSMAVKCTGFTDATNSSIGGSQSLWNGPACTDVNGVNCVNPEQGGAHQDASPAFFAPANNGGNYWYDDTTNIGKSTFSGNGLVTCTVYAGTTKSGSSKLKREDDEIEAVQIETRDALPLYVSQSRPHVAQNARTHARGMRNIVNSQKT